MRLAGRGSLTCEPILLCFYNRFNRDDTSHLRFDIATYTLQPYSHSWPFAEFDTHKPLLIGLDTKSTSRPTRHTSQVFRKSTIGPNLKFVKYPVRRCDASLAYRLVINRIRQALGFFEATGESFQNEVSDVPLRCVISALSGWKDSWGCRTGASLQTGEPGSDQGTGGVMGCGPLRSDHYSYCEMRHLSPYEGASVYPEVDACEE